MDAMVPQSLADPALADPELADPALADPEAVVRRVFGFPGFRGLQEQVVRHVVGGGDALVLMPTGGGKSLCYQVPALCLPGTAVVVSPLIALMDDQVAALRQLGIAAGALHSDLEPAEARSVTRDLIEGQLDLLYVSPERLLGNGTLERLSRLKLALFAIDEAHCVSQWGHEFRPEYRALSCLPGHFPAIPRIALTATADPRTRIDILRGLAMPDAEVFVASFHRPNLAIAAAPKVGETAQLLEVLARHVGECGIVYCGSRAKTERIAQKLQDRNIPAVPFHAGLDPAHKRASLTRFRSGEPVVIVATIAFGMGIDRPDVRFVVHLDMPDSPEAWYQQIGRAGRDGEPAEGLLLYGGQDIAQARHWLAQSSAPDAQKHVMRAKLEEMIALTETASCRTAALLACFGETLPEPCAHCDTCLAPPSTVDATEESRKLLSAVYRTGQLFGAIHLASVLRGEKTDAVLRHGHDRLSTFGLGADRTSGYWRGLIRQLIGLGVLDIDTEGHGGLFLVAEKARPILRGEQSVTLREAGITRPRRGRDPAAAMGGPAPGRARGGPAYGGAASGGPGFGGSVPEGLFGALRAWRAAEARAQSIPPYVIFHDTVLRDIAAVRPQTLDELAEIKGVGASKLHRYGARVLAVLAEAGAA
jgi:ATP-dependent DNA helicase RecQ